MQPRALPTQRPVIMSMPLRNVNGNVQGLTFVKPHGGVLPVARQGLFKTRAEKRIHDRVGFPCTVGIRHGFAARFLPGFVHCLGVICFGGIPVTVAQVTR